MLAPLSFDAVLDALAAEAAEDHAMHRADARAGEHGDRRLRNHRHVNEDAVAFLAAIALQHIGKQADFAVKLLVGEDAPFAGFAFPDDGGLVAARTGEMPIEAVFADVELAADKPLGERQASNRGPLSISCARAGPRPPSPRISPAT